MAPNQRFGRLLSEGVSSVARGQGKTIAAVEREIAEKLGYSPHTVQRWKRGHLPKEPDQVEYLVRYCVTYGRVDREWARSILTQARHPKRAALLQELFPELPEQTQVPRVYQNLPPRYGDFLGREGDMARVLEGLASRWPLVSIEGLGGVGKTTLAIETARRCLPGSDAALKEPFEAVVWVSAKDRPEQKQWLNEVLDTIARVLDYPYITQLPAPEKQTEVGRLLRAHRTLVIVDNFETIEDPDLVAWMQRVPEPSKVLITSRHAQLRTTWPVTLRGLDEPEAIQLIRNHARRLGLRGLEGAADDILRPLVRVTDGNPKAIEMALGHVKYGGLSLAEVVDHLHAASRTVGDIFEDLFARSWEMLTEDARHVLLVMPFFRESAVREGLGAAAGLAGYRLDMALEQLGELSLLDVGRTSGQSPRRYSVHPLTRAFARAKLDAQPEWEREARERWVRWYADFLYQHRDEDWPAFEALVSELENILAVIDWALANTHPLAPELVQSFWKFLYVRGYWSHCETYTRQAIEQADRQQETALRLWLASHLGWLFVNQWRLEEATTWLHRVEDEINAAGCPELLAETDVLNYLGQLYLSLNELDRAAAYERRFLELAERTGDQRGALTARYYLGRIQVQRGQLADAVQRFHSLVTRAREIGWERAEAYCAYRSAEALIRLGQLEEAERWLHHAMSMAERWQDIQLQAYCHLQRGELLWRRGQNSEALQAARTAQDLYHRLGIPHKEEQAVALINRLRDACARGAENDG